MKVVERPHCQARQACVAKTPGKHCRRCTTASPETRAARSASIRRKMAEDDGFRERRLAQLAARRADPEVEARRLAALRVACADQGYRERLSAEGVRVAARRMADPEQREALRRCGREHGARNFRKGQSAEARAKAGAAIRALHLSWCPEEYWALNAQLKRKGILLDERKRMIAELVDRQSEAAEGRRIVAQLRHDNAVREARRKAQAY